MPLGLPNCVQCREELTRLVEDLDAVVVAVTHEDPAPGGIVRIDSVDLTIWHDRRVGGLGEADGREDRIPARTVAYA